MSTFYSIGGILCLIIGLYITIKQLKIFRSHQQDELGFDIGLLSSGFMFMLIGIALIFKYG